jgi:hypothetical protein
MKKHQKILLPPNKKINLPRPARAGVKIAATTLIQKRHRRTPKSLIKE